LRHPRTPLMLDVFRRSTRGLALSSVLISSLMVAVACDPNAEQASTSTDELNTPALDDSGEQLTPDSPEEWSVELPSQQGALENSTPDTELNVSAQAITGIRTVAAWEQLFLRVWSTSHTSDYLPKSQSYDSWQFYNLGYGIDGNTAMYRATGNTQYLDRALLYVNNVVNHARVSSTMPSNFRDSYLGWIATSIPEVQNQEVPLYESYCWRYVTRMLRVIRETPTLYSNPTYRSQYDRLLAFTEKNIFEKWYKRGANAYVYRARTHMASHWALIAMDLSRMTTDATKKATYLTVVNNINLHMPNVSSSLRQQMKPSAVNSSAYFWSDVWGSASRPGQDVAHGNAVIAYVVEAQGAGIEWNTTDMSKFVATLNNVIWPSATRYGTYVDGTGSGTGWFNDGFVKLGRYDANLQRRLEAHTVAQNIQYFGNGALNAAFLNGTAR
jgi:hypothetical protein